jgi:hypothetical protein
MKTYPGPIPLRRVREIDGQVVRFRRDFTLTDALWVISTWVLILPWRSKLPMVSVAFSGAGKNDHRLLSGTI